MPHECGWCDGTGECPDCEGGVDDYSDPCPACAGGGDCPVCEGLGEVDE